MMAETHVPALKLRRYFVGELQGDEQSAIAAHTQACASCRARLRQLEDERSRFFAAVSEDRFTAGVERAARVPRPSRRPATTRSFATVMGLGFAATGLALFLGAKPLLHRASDPGAETAEEEAPRAHNSSKGAAGISVRIAAAADGAQREARADAPESLAPGERVRIGYLPEGHRFVFVLSLDTHGRVTSLYPEAGRSLPVVNGTGFRYFPDSLEFTGEGWERLIVVLTDNALDPEAIVQAAATAYRAAGGDVSRLGSLSLPGEQFHRLFRKPGPS